jgi:putative spermidine/putrescine transport system substrate-binding protein
MTNRRSFLLGAGMLALSQMVAGCNNAQQASLRVKMLRNSIPVQLLNEFRKSLDQPLALDFAPVAQLKELFEQLKAWQQPIDPNHHQGLSLPFFKADAPIVADLVTLGDYWLATAIQQKLIQPIAPESLKNWQQLPQQWQNLVKRNPQGEVDTSGKVWGAPYRWGSTVIIYRPDKFKALGWTPQDWQDLWRPELRDRISLLDQSREVIGLTLKSLGHSYNTPDLTQVPKLKQTLQQLHQQVKFYSSDAYLQPLLLEDTWLAVGWSTDVLQITKTNSDIAAIVPQSGTALWADLWVRPTASDTQSRLELVQKWIDFCWQPASAQAISLLSRAASPVLINTQREQLPPEIRDNQVLLPNAEILQKSEFLQPLSAASEKQYSSLWQEIRQQGSSLK